jgi:hypothetical protein
MPMCTMLTDEEVWVLWGPSIPMNTTRQHQIWVVALRSSHVFELLAIKKCLEKGVLVRPHGR